MIEFSSLQVGDWVQDTWFEHFGYGKVVKIYKKTVHILWSSPPFRWSETNKMIYDKQHAEQFLKFVGTKIC